MSLFILLLMLVSLMFMFTNTPLMISLIIVFQTIIISLTIYTLTKTVWFSFILMMVFLSGMMIIFIYISSLASNEFISLNSPMHIMSLFMIFILLFIILPVNFTNNTPFLNLNQTSMNTINSSLIYKIYSYNSSYLTIIMITYLLITLFSVLKNSMINSAPLRSTI